MKKTLALLASVTVLTTLGSAAAAEVPELCVETSSEERCPKDTYALDGLRPSNYYVTAPGSTKIFGIRPHRQATRVGASDSRDGRALWGFKFTVDGYPLRPYQVIASNDGEYLALVGTYTRKERPRREIGSFVAVVDADRGRVLWTRRGRRNLSHTRLAFDPDGEVLYAGGGGEIGGERTTADATVTSYAVETGEVIWSGSVTGRTGRHHSVPFIVADRSGVFILVNDYHDGRLWPAAYGFINPGRSGRRTPTWRRELGASPVHVLEAGPEDPNLLLSNGSESTDTVYANVVALDKRTGMHDWSRRFRLPGWTWAWDTRLVPGPPGKALVATDVVAGGSHVISLTYFDTDTGTILWRAKYEEPHGDAFVHHVGFSPDDRRLYVTGSSRLYGTDLTEVLTLGYSAQTGVLRWTGHHDGDQPIAMTVRNDGPRVAVRGTDDELKRIEQALFYER